VRGMTDDYFDRKKDTQVEEIQHQIKVMFIRQRSETRSIEEGKDVGKKKKKTVAPTDRFGRNHNEACLSEKEKILTPSRPTGRRGDHAGGKKEKMSDRTKGSNRSKKERS